MMIILIIFTVFIGGPLTILIDDIDCISKCNISMINRTLTTLKYKYKNNIKKKKKCKYINTHYSHIMKTTTIS